MSNGIAIHNDYDGLGFVDTRGLVPGDPQIATGSSHHVVAINSQVGILNKEPGLRRFRTAFEPLFEDVLPSGGFPFDPRLRYDPVEDRFVFLATQSLSGTGSFLLGVSDGANPNGIWNIYEIVPERSGGLVDYPELGLDRDAVYLTQNFFSGGFQEVELVILDKADLYAGRDVSASHFTDLRNPDGTPAFTVQPSLQPTVSAEGSGAYYLLNSRFGPEKLTLWEVNDPVSAPTVSSTDVNVAAYGAAPPADQPGTSATLDTVSVRLMNVAHDDGSLFTAHTVGDGDNAVIKWYEIDADAATAVQDAVLGRDGQDLFFPTVGANGDSVMIVHNVSGPNTFPGVAVSGRTNEFTPNQIEETVVVQPGQSKYDVFGGGVQRWGDYNGIAVDPQRNSYWCVSQYSPAVDRFPGDPYNTRVAEVSF